MTGFRTPLPRIRGLMVSRDMLIPILLGRFICQSRDTLSRDPISRYPVLGVLGIQCIAVLREPYGITTCTAAAAAVHVLATGNGDRGLTA